jgi:hypothetical protein
MPKTRNSGRLREALLREKLALSLLFEEQRI